MTEEDIKKLEANTQQDRAAKRRRTSEDTAGTTSAQAQADVSTAVDVASLPAGSKLLEFPVGNAKVTGGDLVCHIKVGNKVWMVNNGNSVVTLPRGFLLAGFGKLPLQWAPFRCLQVLCQKVHRQVLQALLCWLQVLRFPARCCRIRRQLQCAPLRCLSVQVLCLLQVLLCWPQVPNFSARCCRIRQLPEQGIAGLHR